MVASAGDTLHSSQEEINENYFISGKPISELNIQLMFEIGPNPEINMTARFRNKTRKKIYEPQFTDNITALRPNRYSEKFKKFIPNTLLTAKFIRQ